MRELAVKSAMILLCLACQFNGATSQSKYKPFEAGTQTPTENIPVSSHACNTNGHRAEADALINLHAEQRLIGSGIAGLGSVKLHTANTFSIYQDSVEYVWRFKEHEKEKTWAIMIRVRFSDRKVDYVKLWIYD